MNYHQLCGLWASWKNMLEMYGEPLVLLIIRLFVANIFIEAGWTKLTYLTGGQSAVLEARYLDYGLSLVSAQSAIWLVMLVQLGCAAMLALGLWTRLGALGLICLSVLVYTYSANDFAPYWGLLCAVLLVRGGGLLAVDAFLWRQCRLDESPE